MRSPTVCVGGQDKESKDGALECIIKMDDSTCLCG